MTSLIAMLINQFKHQYMSAEKQPDISNESFLELDFTPSYTHHVIVPIDDLNVMVVKALRYARSLTPNVIAFHVEVYEGEADKLRQKWGLINTKIPLIIKFSPDHDIVNLLTEFISSEEYASQPGDAITVLLPQLVVSHRWEMALHNNNSLYISNAMLKKRNVTVSTIPFYLDDIKRFTPLSKPSAKFKNI